MANAECTHCHRENCGNHPWFFAARSYSHTDRRMCIKILTRGMKNRCDAEVYMQTEKEIDRKKRKCKDWQRPRFFIIQTDHENGNL